MINYKIKIFDNFLQLEDLEKLNTYAKTLTKKSNIDIFHNQINNNNEILKSSIDKDFLIKLNKTYLEKAKLILKELNEEKVSLIDYSDFSIVKTKKNKKFPVHDDDFDKLLSGVIYLHPEKNTGTIFYSSKIGKDKTITEWKVNRAVFFSRIEKKTWHSYEADDCNDRIVLVFNLMTKKSNIKKVFKIEKTNYFIAKIRHIMNHHLYRFFGFTI